VRNSHNSVHDSDRASVYTAACSPPATLGSLRTSGCSPSPGRCKRTPALQEGPQSRRRESRAWEALLWRPSTRTGRGRSRSTTCARPSTMLWPGFCNAGHPWSRTCSSRGGWRYRSLGRRSVRKEIRNDQSGANVKGPRGCIESEIATML
jgi:hypothetical protein